MNQSAMEQRIKGYILDEAGDKRINSQRDSFWDRLRSAGTTIWLDTGDIDEAEAVWTREMTALTTNNTLINKVIQKGIYDTFISRSAEIVASLPSEKQVVEMAFILNAMHGLRLVKHFGVDVSVELHTDTANDVDAIVQYGTRYHDICPEKFIIKVPYTPSGLIGARKLADMGIRINLTLGFSARQNVLTSYIARPAFLNVFLGRIGAYIADNKLGTGNGAGERTVIETQKHIHRLNRLYNFNTRLIAASLRTYDQLADLAGVDVFTIPPVVASKGRKNLDGKFVSRLESDYHTEINTDMVTSGITKFWRVTPELEKVASELGKELPAYGDIIKRNFDNAGFVDLFPSLSIEEKNTISEDGKIPVLKRWEKDILNGNIAPDTLLNLAGLESFTKDQGDLDKRIKDMMV